MFFLAATACAFTHLPAVRAANTTAISVNLSCGPNYAPGSWVPIKIRLQNPTDQPGDGTVIIPAASDTAAEIRQPVYVPSQSVVVFGSNLFAGIPGTKSAQPAAEIATAIWQAADGRSLDRTPILGRRQSPPTGERAHDVNGDLPGQIVLEIDSLDVVSNARSWHDVLPEMLQFMTGARTTAYLTGAVDDLPRTLLSYQPFNCILLEAPPDDLDAAQGQSLLQKVQTGATLIIASPPPEMNLAQSWLASYLPVRLMGRRDMNAVDALEGGGQLKFIEKVTITEAAVADAGVQVVLSDKDFVHAAVRHVGLGRIVYISFPVGALDSHDGRTIPIWRELLGQDRTSGGAVDAAVTADQRRQAISSLVGRPAPHWRAAAAVAGFYVLAVLVIQMLFRGVRRPAAFAMVAVVAVLTGTVMVVITLFKHAGQPISGGRVAMLDLGPDGRGIQYENIAFLGQNRDDFQLNSSRSDAAAIPVDFDPRQAPTFTPVPFSILDAGVSVAEIRRIWQASAATIPGQSFTISGIFTPDGLKLSTQSHLQGPVKSPLLVWGVSLLRLPEAQTGSNDAVVSLNDLNPPGVYTYGGGIVSTDDRLRGWLIQNMLAPTMPTLSIEAIFPKPMYIGWIDSQLAPALLDPANADHLSMKDQIMLRAPVMIEPSAVGTRVHIEGPFNRLARAGKTSGLPIDSQANVSANLPGSWEVQIVPPPQVGRLRPTRATVSADVDAPQSVISIETNSASTVATWPQAITHQTASFDVGPEDISPDGTLVFRIATRHVSASASVSDLPRWALHRLAVSIDADVIGPPQATSLNSELENPEAERPTKPKVSIKKPKPH